MTFGEWGERKAAAYLQKIGYRILARNFRCKGGEIDIIALDGDILVFVEVKARQSLVCGAPGLAVTREKRRKIQLAVQVYLKRIKGEMRDRRMDLVEVLYEKGRTCVRHTKGIF